MYTCTAGLACLVQVRCLGSALNSEQSVRLFIPGEFFLALLFPSVILFLGGDSGRLSLSFRLSLGQSDNPQTQLQSSGGVGGLFSSSTSTICRIGHRNRDYRDPTKLVSPQLFLVPYHWFFFF